MGLLWQLIFMMWRLSCAGGTSCLLSSSSLTEYTENGDITLALIGPINSASSLPVINFTVQPAPRRCDLFRRDQYKSILALLFAVEEVNQNPHFLPNITLGFRMWDSCFSEMPSLRATFQAMTGKGPSAPNYKCGSQPRIPAVIGDPLSTSSVAIARLLGLWGVPQASYASSLPSLSNKLEFPSFLRTIVSVDSQPYAVLEMCKMFGWNWIGVLISSTDYGTQGGSVLKTEATRNGVCIAFYETISSDQSFKRMPKVIERVRRSTATVIVLYASPPEVNAVFVEVLQQNLTGKVWVGIEAWYSSPVFLLADFWHLLNNTIGIARSRKILPNFSRFLQTLSPSRYPTMLAIRQFWERSFNCKWVATNSSLGSLSTTSRVCTGLEKLATDDITEFNDPTSQAVYMAHNAIYAIAHALNDLLSCKDKEGPFQQSSCADKTDFQPWQLLHYLKRVRFVNTAGELVSFDANGDIYGYFDILNWRLDGNNVSRYVKVGTFDNYAATSQKLSVNHSLVQWPGGHGQVPRSVCSDSCPPGHWKAPQRGQPVCCFDCITCPDGTISNQINSVTCFTCPEDQWPNTERSKCIPKIIEFLSYEEPLGLVLALFSVIFSLITVTVLLVYIKFRETPVVKANNRSLSYLLLVSLICCFLCSLVFMGYPVRMTCTVRQAFFGITFSLCISCVLAKTIIVVIAFKATKPGSNLRMWVGSQTAILVVCSSSCGQVFIITMWLVMSPPFLEPNMHLVVGKILLECNEGSIIMFYLTLGYLVFLALLSFVVAFLARSLPDSFNEAKYITFSMIMFLSVWASFIPAYLSTKGKYVVAVEIFAILLSSFGLLGCIFFPKCYIIILRPSMNTREYLMSSRSS
ncbi:extracellular calcium-sensing receptor-like [Spea bombifrons]|uniref:extracellular calcium-sensing receptor-like n=1 Tax=Spea bombifrons TaxID=233779 RepID=UPI002349065C|nr:extracellular calcium-sensing receptor-like [Spea bombifrons]